MYSSFLFWVFIVYLFLFLCSIDNHPNEKLYTEYFTPPPPPLHTFVIDPS